MNTERIAALDAMRTPGEMLTFGSVSVMLRFEYGKGDARRWWVTRGDAASRMARSARRADFYISECERWDPPVEHGGRRRGAGRPPLRGAVQSVRRQLVLTEAEAAEIGEAVDGEPVGPWMVNASLLHARAMRDPNLRAGLTRAMSLLDIDPGAGIDAEVVRMTITWLEEQVTGRPSCEVTDEIRHGAKAEIKRLLG